MADTPPIACTLEAAEAAQRAREIRKLGDDGLLSVDRQDRSVTLRFRPDPGIRDRVEAIAVAEGRCCSFLAFDVTTDDEATMLTIAAPAAGEPVMRELAAMFEGSNPSPSAHSSVST